MYQKLLAQTDTTKSTSNYSAQQKRKKIKKELWKKVEGQLLQTVLHSEFSELVMERNQGATVMVEYFDQMECWTQEKIIHDLEGDKQLICHIQANQAVYSYATQELKGEHVHLSRYLLQGDQLQPLAMPKQLLIEGIVERVCLSFKENSPLVVVDGFQGKLYELGAAF
jgi:hypothetical protein